MALLNLDPITPRAVTGFHRFLGASLIARMLTDLSAGIYRVHSRELFPWRHLPIVPLYPPSLLLLEWLLLISSGAALLLFPLQRATLRVALWIALTATVMGLSQRYSNQTALALIVLLSCVLKPATAEDLKRELDYPNLDLVRYQLLIVYGFSALNKISAGFLSGEALSALLRLQPVMGQSLSWAVVLAELALPVLFITRKSRIGWLGVLVLHTAFSVLMPGLLPFGLLMLALATLWLR
jgi:hypothetical protein